MDGHTHTRTHAYTHTRTRTHALAHTCTHTHAHTHTRTHTHTHTQTHTSYAVCLHKKKLPLVSIIMKLIVQMIANEHIRHVE